MPNLTTDMSYALINAETDRLGRTYILGHHVTLRALERRGLRGPPRSTRRIHPNSFAELTEQGRHLSNQLRLKDNA